MIKHFLGLGNETTLDYSGSTPNTSVKEKSLKFMSKDEQLQALMNVIENQKEVIAQHYIEKTDYMAMLKDLHMRLRESKNHDKETNGPSNDEEEIKNNKPNLNRWETLENLSSDETVVEASTPMKHDRRHDFKQLIRDDTYQQGLASIPFNNRINYGPQKRDNNNFENLQKMQYGMEAYQQGFAPSPDDFKHINRINDGPKTEDSSDPNNDNFSSALQYTLKKSLYKFHGKPNEDLDDWIFSMERFFKKYRIKEREKVEIAVDYLRENARTTYRSIPNY